MTKATFSCILLTALALATAPVLARAENRPADGSGQARQRPVTAQEALAYLRQRDWAKAAAAYEQLVRANPEDGQNWLNYAFVALAGSPCPTVPGT
jgi:Tfp pilus assembly protein PilF